jgi:hypothetical protein
MLIEARVLYFNRKMFIQNLQMPKFPTTVKMNTLISMFHFLLHNYTTDLSNVLKLSRIFAMQWNLYIMLKIYNPQILFWICCKLVTEKLYHMMFYQVHLTIDCTGAVNPTTIWPWRPWIKLLWKYFSSWASIFMVWLKITSSWIWSIIHKLTVHLPQGQD